MKYYFTTPIYYTNGAPHIGHTYTTIVCDVIRRLKRLEGYEVALTSGADEHGVNVERSAERVGKTPYDFSTVMANEFRMHWEELRIQPDDFVRTSDERHARTVQWMFERCRANGYVYKGSYTGQYCVFDNLYVNEAKPGDPCPECGRPTETVTEENFFFKLSAFQERLLELYESQPDFILPETRRNEVLAFVKGGLQDLSITRTTIKWGIPVPGEAPHVFYVWFDALIAYLTGAGGPDWEQRGLWPADLHMIGKEITRFHAIFWPAFLMAAGLPLPKRIFAHGWLLFEQDKMSKSRGNIVRPRPIAEVCGIDALRYFLLREIVFGQDGSFSYDALVGRYNSDLANGLGNLASRTLSMIHQYRGGAVPDSKGDPHIADALNQTVAAALDGFNKFEFSRALETIWQMISVVDKYIVERAPWKLAKSKDEAAPELLDRTLYSAAEVLRVLCGLLAPVLPDSVAKIWSLLGFAEPVGSLRTADLTFGLLKAGQKIPEVQPVFPRIEAKPAIARMRELEEVERARQDALLGKTPAPAAGAEAPKAEAAAPAASDGTITIDDFVKVDLRVGIVKSAAAVKGADKLLHMYVDIGEPEPRSIVAGIAKAYQPETLVGRKVVIVANLQPRKLRGLDSQGMIVAASLEGGLPVLAGFLEDVPVGARLK
ncbi:MAG: methionine--tRNA ligase [Acidobacteria bacterium]|nr:methionine--tRNA ligase [Acidobacteriota bacterium]